MSAEVKCIVCGKVFVPRSGRGHNRVTCSEECHRIRAREIDRLCKARRAVHNVRRCATCGKVFTVVGGSFRHCPLCRSLRKAGKDTTMGLSLAARNAIAWAQDRLSQPELYAASQNWTPAERKYALARWREKHGL